MTDPIKAEPVAWLYGRGSERKAYIERSQAALVCSYTETPLYTHAQLVEERRLAWNEAIEAAARENLMICLTNCEELTDEAMEALNFAADRIRALSVPAIVEAGEHQPKENSDASSD